MEPYNIGPGYHSRGQIWLGEAGTSTVFDTGATRNSISKDYLKALLTEEKTQGCVLEIKDLEHPLECSSVDARQNMFVKQVAWIRTEFRA